MKIQQLARLLFVSFLALLAACGAPAAPLASSLPASTVAPPTALPMTPTVSTTAATDPDQPNDSAQARLRVSNCLFHGPAVDLFVNGKVPMNGGKAQTGLPAPRVGGYLFLAPGTYQVAVAPAGKGLGQALVSPLAIPLVAGHRYTLVVLGQAGDASHTPLVIDETAAYQAIGASPSGASHITVNNLKGAAGIDFSEAGITREKDTTYGGFKAALWPVGNFKGLAVTISGAPDQLIDSTPGGWNTPGTDSLDCFTGTYPGAFGQDYESDSSPSTSPLSVVDLLKGYHDIQAGADGPPSFDTLLTALHQTGLDKVLTTGGANLVLAPTDAAFAELPKARREALLADPKTLADVLRAHIIPGYYPVGSLSGPTFGVTNRTLTNMLGAKLTLRNINGKLSINGDNVGDLENLVVANGTRVWQITKVLLPAAK